MKLWRVIKVAFMMAAYVAGVMYAGFLLPRPHSDVAVVTLIIFGAAATVLYLADASTGDR